MKADRLREIERVFAEVQDLRPTERETRLAALCRADAELRREVEALLGHDARAAGFLERPVLELPLSSLGIEAPEPSDTLVGAALGPWRLERRLASGGMGTVYLGARADGQYQQQVAVKVVKRGMDSEEIRRRFGEERRTLAAVSHPNIARILDGGVTPDDRPYLVMEYVPGLPIDGFCDSRALTTTQRLRLFGAVCAAVSAAHRALVVHRDLKPSNILVTEDGTPKLLDFGIAKVLGTDEAAGSTVAAERRLTPEYSSPEQIAGRPLTTSTDVYSLGVVLYELLTGHRPYRFQTRTTAEFERVVCQIDPPAPSDAIGRAETRIGLDARREGRVSPEGVGVARRSTPGRLRRQLRGDLDTIVLTAMRKEPERRYATVDQLASDIDRYLAGMPIAARRDTFAYRTSKFVRRHSFGTMMAAGLALIAGAGVVGVVWESGKARRERDAAYLARDQAEQVVEFLRQMLASASPGEAGPDATLRHVLDQTAETIEGELGSQPLVLASVRSTIGRTYQALGDLDLAERHIDGAYRQRLEILGPDHHDVAESQMDLASLRYDQARYDEADALLRAALEMHRRQRGERNADTARVLNDLGAVARAAGRLQEAERLHREALDIRRETVGAESLPVAESLNNLAGALMAQNDLAGAQESAGEALRIRRALLAPDHPLVYQSISNVGTLAVRRGEYDRGIALLRESVAIGERKLGPRHIDYAKAVANLAGALWHAGRPAEAEPLYRVALGIREAGLDESHPLRIQSTIDLGRCLLALNRGPEAEPLLRAGVDRLTGPEGKVEPRGHAALEDLIRVLDAAGRNDQARAYESRRPD